MAVHDNIHRCGGNSATCIMICLVACMSNACSFQRDQRRLDQKAAGTAVAIAESSRRANAPLAAKPSAGGSDSCHRPKLTTPRRTFPVQLLDSLVGHYTITLVRVSSGGSVQSTEGRLTLYSTDSTRRYYTLSPDYPDHIGPWGDHILYGATDLARSIIGGANGGYSWTSTDPDAPGVQVNRTGDMSFGAAVAPKAGVVADAGISLRLFAVSSRTFSGYWTANGTARPSIGGYFCAVRY
jgi:hypothetical protein